MDGSTEAQLLEWFQNYGVFGVIAVLFLCTYGLPFSKNIVILSCGVLVSQKMGTAAVLIPACIVGMFAGDFSLFLAARTSWQKVEKYFSPVMSNGKVQKVQVFIKKYGLYPSVFMARFLPYIRTPLYLNAGLNQMKVGGFILVDILSLLLYVPILFYIGLTGMNFLSLTTHSTTSVLMALLAMTLLTILVCLGSLLYSRQRKTR